MYRHFESRKPKFTGPAVVAACIWVSKGLTILPGFLLVVHDKNGVDYEVSPSTVQVSPACLFVNHQKENK